jgi:YVTN family beta-propeller protein
MKLLPIAVALLAGLAGCSSPAPEAAKAPPPAPKRGAYAIYVTNENGGDVSVIDSDSLEVTSTIAVGKRPRGIHAAPDGRTFYVALSGSPPAPPGVDESTLPPPDKSADGIGVVDVEQEKVVRVIKSGSDPEEFDLSRDGKLLFVSNEDDGKVSITDIADGRLIDALKVGAEPEGVTTSPDGKFVYVTSEDEGTVTVVDTVARKSIKTIKVGRRPRSVAFLPDGSRAYVTNENDGVVTLMDAVKHRTIRQIRLGEAGKVKPMKVIVSKDGTKVYVSTGRGNKVFTIDPATNEPAGSIEVGKRPWGLALSPDGKRLFAADGPSNSIAVIDLSTQTVVKNVKAGQGPWGVMTLAR